MSMSQQGLHYIVNSVTLHYVRHISDVNVVKLSSVHFCYISWLNRGTCTKTVYFKDPYYCEQLILEY